MKPVWFKQKIEATEFGRLVRMAIDKFSIHTICTEARCPNRNFCFNRKSLTILILGDRCTRNCAFCSVNKGLPVEPDKTEPERVAELCKTLTLRHIVITSVTRDDLKDGGAKHFADVVRAIKSRCENIVVEVLVPDFLGKLELVDIVLSSGVDIFGHNLETVPRLYPSIRPKANYERSLKILTYAASKGIRTKTAIMVGCGETKDEVLSVVRDVSLAGVKYIVIGQYLQPSSAQIPVSRFVSPQEFDEYAEYAKNLGLVPFAFPLARSSFMSESYVDGEISSFDGLVNKKQKEV